MRIECRVESSLDGRSCLFMDCVNQPEWGTQNCSFIGPCHSVLASVRLSVRRRTVRANGTETHSAVVDEHVCSDSQTGVSPLFDGAPHKPASSECTRQHYGHQHWLQNQGPTLRHTEWTADPTRMSLCLVSVDSMAHKDRETRGARAFWMRLQQTAGRAQQLACWLVGRWAPGRKE